MEITPRYFVGNSAIAPSAIGSRAYREVREELPLIEGVSEGDTCTIHEGPYAYYYEAVDGRWGEVGSTAPWQLSVG